MEGNNNSIIDIEDHFFWPLSFQLPDDLIICLVMCIISIVAMATNVLSLVTMWKTRWILESGTFILASLAVADLLIGVTIPLNIVNVYSLDYDSVGSYLVDAITGLPVQSSIMHIVFVAVDRFIAIVAPLKYDVLLAPKRVKIGLAVVWASCFGRVFPLFALYAADVKVDGAAGNSPSTNKSSKHTIRYRHDEGVYVLISEISTYAVSLILLLFMYRKMWTIAKEQREKIETQIAGGGATTSAGRKKANTTVSCILLAYTVTYIPVYVVRSLSVSDVITDKDTEIHAFSAAASLAYVNSCINFFVYAWTNTQFRKAYRDIIFRKKVAPT